MKKSLQLELSNWQYSSFGPARRIASRFRFFDPSSDFIPASDFPTPLLILVIFRCWCELTMCGYVETRRPFVLSVFNDLEGFSVPIRAILLKFDNIMRVDRNFSWFSNYRTDFSWEFCIPNDRFGVISFTGNFEAYYLIYHPLKSITSRTVSYQVFSRKNWFQNMS